MVFLLRVTVVKDKKTRESKGVAFVLFLKEEEALNFVSSFDRKQVRFLNFIFS